MGGKLPPDGNMWLPLPTRNMWSISADEAMLEGEEHTMGEGLLFNGGNWAGGSHPGRRGNQ